MAMNITYINLFYGFIAVVLLAGSLWAKPKTNGWLFYIAVIAGFIIGGVIIRSYYLAVFAFLAGAVSVYKLWQLKRENRPMEVVFISDRDDNYLHHFLEYYHADISKYFPAFDFKIEEEYLVALLLSEMETVGLIIAEIKNAETLRICVDYIVPKYRQSQLAKTFYNCELRWVDFLGYRYLYIDPQSEAHNHYLERIGFILVDGKYINSI
ncbi:MAG TPA: hypothetical protein VFC36_01025 [Paludibacter sp.]|nr:hypothetical protein [Paludibacter sp.]